MDQLKIIQTILKPLQSGDIDKFVLRGDGIEEFFFFFFFSFFEYISLTKLQRRSNTLHFSLEVFVLWHSHLVVSLKLK